MYGLYRKAERDLATWFSRKRRKPLVIRGARQVGKSTLVRRFASERELELAELNLEQHRTSERVFANLNVNAALAEIEHASGKRVGPNTLLFLDEIQATPSALPLLRYFHEQRPELPVIAAGSLLEFLLGDHDFSMPVGRIEYLHLGPMGFREFLVGVGEDLAIETMAALEPGEPLPDALHRKLLDLQRAFLLVGGMPEAVAEYAEARSLGAAFDCQQSIIATHRDDFAKYGRGTRNLLRLQSVFDYVPSSVGNKLIYTRISQDDRARDLRTALEMLINARLVIPVYHSHCAGLPLEAGVSSRVLKTLFLDVGLVCRMLGLDVKAIRGMNERTLINEGGLAEQFVGQHLAYAAPANEAPRLHYWLREARHGNAEIDYVRSFGDWIVPIEVKAGKTGRLRSLQQFVAAKAPPLAVRFDLNQPSLHELEWTKDQAANTRLLSLPLYLVEELPRMVDWLR